jgi:hypothetical protein
MVRAGTLSFPFSKGLAGGPGIITGGLTDSVMMSFIFLLEDTEITSASILQIKN